LPKRQAGRRLIFSFLSNNQQGKNRESTDAVEELCVAMIEEFNALYQSARDLLFAIPEIPGERAEISVGSCVWWLYLKVSHVKGIDKFKNTKKVRSISVGESPFQSTYTK
jgi:hypothetical protein